MSEIFDLKTRPDAERLAYYGAMFAMAAIDGQMDREEIGLIFECLDEEGLAAESRVVLRSYLASPPNLRACLNILSAGCTELRYGVMVALMDVALRDAVFAPAEQAAIRDAQEQLAISADQLKAIETFCREANRVREGGPDDNLAAEALKKAASGLTAVGIPIAAVYFSGTVMGLSAAGITSGLAALGLGLGMVPGVGVAVLIGVGVFYTVNKVFGLKKSRGKAAAQADRERRAQLVIKGLQVAINDLAGKVGNLQADAATAQANEAAIVALNQRLLALQQLLARRQVAIA